MFGSNPTHARLERYPLMSREPILSLLSKNIGLGKSKGKYGFVELVGLGRLIRPVTFTRGAVVRQTDQSGSCRTRLRCPSH